MDGVSIAANIVGIATAGAALSIKFATLGTQISTASERVSSIGNDISLTCGVLHQLGELMTQKTADNGISIFSQGGLESTRTSAAMCERIFREVEIELRRASEQIRGSKCLSGGKIRLSRTEKAKWPFLQPSIDVLRADLREAKGTLMLMLQVTSLALSKRMADLNQSASSNSEQRDFMRAIVALHQQQQAGNEELERKPSARSGNTASSYSTTMADCSSTDGLLSGAVKASAPLCCQPSALPERTKARTRIVKPVGKSEDQTAQTRGTSRHSMTSTSGSLAHDFPPHTSLAAFSTSSLSRTSEDSKMAWSGPSKDHLQPSRTAGESIGEPDPDRELSKELNLSLLKPIVRDFFDKVEISWSVQDTRVKPSAIHKYLQKNEEDGVPSVVDMLEKLYGYEQAIVDKELSKTRFRSEGALLSLKRTMTDMRHRDMTFRDVPGLQFAIERQVASAEPRTADKTVGPEMLGLMQENPADPLRFENEIEALLKGSLAGLEDCFVVRYGMAEDRDGNIVGLVVQDDIVEDRDGNIVGFVVEGDPRQPSCRSTSGYGDNIDQHGNVIGHAQLREAPEEEVTDLSSLDGKLVSRTGSVIDKHGSTSGRIADGDPVTPVGHQDDGKGLVLNDNKEVIGQAELLPGGSTLAVGQYPSWNTQPQKTADVLFPSAYSSSARAESDMVGEPADLQINPRIESSPVKSSGDLEAASWTADEKRKRNATASVRFRQRRHEKEREAAEEISKLKQQLREKESLLRHESVDSTGVYDGLLSEEVIAESDDDEDWGTDQGVQDDVVDALLKRYTTIST